MTESPRHSQTWWYWVGFGGVAAILGVAAVGIGAMITISQAPKTKAVAAAQQTRMVAPTSLSGLPRIDDPRLQGVLDEFEGTLAKAGSGETSTVVAAYGNLDRTELIVVAGVSAPLRDPAKELNDAMWSAAVSAGDGKGYSYSKVDPGPLGGLAKCGWVGLHGEHPTAICGWADVSGVGVILWASQSERLKEPSPTEFTDIRAQIQQRQ